MSKLEKVAKNRMSSLVKQGKKMSPEMKDKRKRKMISNAADKAFNGQYSK